MIRYKNQSIQSSFKLFWNLDALKGSKINSFKIDFFLLLYCNFIAGRPKAALVFWLFDDFRCGVSLFIVIRVMYKYKNR